MEMPRHGRKAGNHEVHEPPDTDADSATETVQGDLLAEQALYQNALFINDHPVRGIYDELAATVLALVMLLAVVDMAIFLELRRLTLRTRLSHAYGHSSPPLAIG
jgi:hypothetical protein